MEKGPASDNLRAKAKKRLEAKPSRERSAAENSQLVEELSIHQEELKIQNEELGRIQSELEVARAKYFELYDLAPVGYITLSPKLMVREANLAASKLFGYSRNILVTKGLSSLISPESHELMYLHFRRVAEGAKDQVHTFAVIDRDGKEHQVQFESNSVKTNPENGFRSILTDVTAIRKAETLLRTANDDLEELNRNLIKREAQLKQKGQEISRSNAELMQYAYVCSHDLQEPLRMVVSYLSLLESRYKDTLDPTAKEFIAQAVQGGERMRELINDLLDYSRVDFKEAKFSDVDMNEVVTKAVSSLGMAIEENDAQIEVSHLPTLKVDASQMVQVMQNLISNAIKFHGPQRPVVMISAAEGSDEWTFSVKDNGIGVNMEYADKIFEMFKKLHTNDQYPGTGIGLAIVKKIIERHGGHVWVESEEGKGATFFFTFPKGSRSDEPA